MPERTAPRALVPPQSANLQTTPRTGWPQQLTAFDLLRAMADDGLVRIAMNDVRGQILGMAWEVKPIDGEKSSPALDKETERIRAWLRTPDQLNRIRFRTFVSKMLEEILVTDALTLIPRYTVKGDFLGCEQIDGATIMPIVDGRGQPPIPPGPGEAREQRHVAYEQIVEGRVETQFTRDELWYMPANPRPNNPYGRSPVEMVLMFINVAMRRGMFDLKWFTEGNIPEGLFSVPEEWTPDMIAVYQRGFNDDSKDGTRSGFLRFVPQGAYHALKAREFNLGEREWDARCICYAFGVSPMPLVQMMNRATAETLESSSLESGVRPVAEHIAEALTLAVQGPLGAPMLQIRPGSDETEDATTVYERNVAYFGRGGMTVGEFVAATGGSPVEGPLKDARVWDTPSGPVLLEDVLRPKPEPAAPGAPPHTTSDQRGMDQAGAAPPDESAAAKDLSRWQTFALKRLRDGRALRKFESAAVPEPIRRRVEFGLMRARTSGQVREVFSAARLRKAAEIEPPSLAGPRAAVQDIIAAWLATNRSRVIGEVMALVDLPAAKLAKDDAPSPPKAPALEEVDLDMSGLIPKLEEAIKASAAVGAGETADAVGFSLDNVPEAALKYARNRAAELVGMRYDDAGRLVVNPDNRFAINETLREDLRSTVAQAIDKGWSPQELTSRLSDVFDRPRAEAVARTETGFAYNEGAADVYEEAGVEKVEILDGDGCLPIGHEEGSPAPSGDPGVIEPESEANGQVWTIAQFRAHKLGHPRCVRGAVAA